MLEESRPIILTQDNSIVASRDEQHYEQLLQRDPSIMITHMLA